MLIKKPNNYLRNLKGGSLKNGIRYVIINDPTINHSFVSCCVGVGSKEDPKELQGLAHFLEHMLFLGSKKYPDAGFYNKFISENGGYSNAYTSFFETNYYYKINDDSLKKSLDIFSRFFIDPLFDKNFLEREINAIQSEHSKNINSDFWLIRQVIFNLSKKIVILIFFSTGNIETLDKPNLREKMMKFFEDYYCSNNMSLVILSSIDIDIIDKYINEIFINIPNKKSKEIILNSEKKYDIKNKEFQLFPVNGSDEFNIIYFWDIKYFANYKYNKVINILDEIITDFNKDTLSYFLKSNGYIHSLYSVINDEGVYILSLNINIEKGELKKIVKEINGYVRYFFKNLKNNNWKKIYDFYEKKNMN